MPEAIKIVYAILENAKKMYEEQTSLADMVTFETPDPTKMQNSGNVLWRNIQQHAPIIEGWSIAGEETDIIEEGYPAILGEPKNDFVKQRIDDLRDMSYWERRGRQAGLRQASELNKSVATQIAQQGSLFYRSNTDSGFDFVAEAQTTMNERQSSNMGRCFILNDRDNQTYASDLAGRQTLQGRPEEAWKKGQIGRNIAEFDVYTGSYLINLAGGASPAGTVDGNQSFKPEAGVVQNTAGTGIVTNNDYRLANIVVDSSAGFNVGDKISFTNTATPVNALGLDDKTDTGQAMTFSIVDIPIDGTHLQVYPKPIALNDATLSTLEKAYANVDTQILNDAIITRLNEDATAKTNIFFEKTSVEIIGGPIPAGLFQSFAGKKVVQDTMSNGVAMYMVYDGDIEDMTFRYRLFTWYGITVANPSNCGVAISY